jgi:hypothetical protein
MIDKNEIKKDLYKSKNMATFSHYSFGKLFYTFDALGTTFMFPINTTESRQIMVGGMGEMDGPADAEYVETIMLSSDLGETNFGQSIKASDLNRWIAKAIDADELVNMKG